MALREELEKQGRWLFRWRSYLPIAIIPLVGLALKQSGGLGRAAGPVVAGIFDGFCMALSMTGLVIRGLTVGHIPNGISTRNRQAGQEDAVRTTGMYSISRHPLYFGNFLIMLGIVMSIQVWWFILVTVLAFWLYYERIMFAEEEGLRAGLGSAYEEWAARTPAFLPRFGCWRPPDVSFSFRNVLRREHTGFFEIIVAFAFLDIVGRWLATGHLRPAWVWLVAVALAFAVYVTLRTLKKRTRILEARDR
jgi:protein-S-isoprenylcysteine O-methyltransferase Ste14